MPSSPNKLLLEIDYGGGDGILLWDTGSGDRALLCQSFSDPDPEQILPLCLQILNLIQKTNIRGGETATENLRALSEELSAVLLPADVRGVLRRSSAEYLTVSMDRSLLPIPWELLHDGKDLFCCRFSMGRQLRDPQRNQHPPRSESKAKLQVGEIADPERNLPAAAHEGKVLFRLFSQSPDLDFHLLRGPTSLAETVACLKEFDVLHFSGHGEVCGGRDGWKVADGVLRSETVQEISRDADSLPRLVFSNACQTALHPNPDSFAETGECHSNQRSVCLAEAFLAGGTSHFVGCLADILDETSQLFAKAFYDSVLAGASIGSALKRARLELRAKPNEADLTWSQYVLYGDPSTGLYGERTTSVESWTILAASLSNSTKTENENGFTSRSRSTVFMIDRIREVLPAFPGAHEGPIDEGKIVLFFPSPSLAVRFALTLRARIDRERDIEAPSGLPFSIAVSMGEVYVEKVEGNSIKIHGRPVRVAEQLLQIARPHQILVGRTVFDNARAILGSKEMDEVGEVTWFDHGAYRFMDFEEPIGVGEVGRKGLAILSPPPDTDYAKRITPADQEPVLGWRPALDLEVPTSPRWVLIQKLGEGGFGEVWRARHKHSGTTRVFKFCFKADRVRSLKREATLFRLLRESIGDHPGIVQVLNTYFEEPPYYIEMEDVAGQNLSQWMKAHGGVENVPLETRLEIAAQIAESLQAAHDAGVIHRDVKPSNILISGEPDTASSVQVKLTDFGIGQIDSKDRLADITVEGFTETYSATEFSSASGTQVYMAPELLVGKQSSTRSDIYSLGVVLYQMLVGDLGKPLASDWRDELPDQPLLVKDLERCLAGEPGKRVAAVGEVALLLRTLEQRSKEQLELERSLARRKRNKILALTGLGTLVVFLLIAVALGVGLLREREARKLAVDEGKRRERAEADALLAMESAQEELYYSSIQLADQAIAEGQFQRGLNLLLACPAQFRYWEWGYLLQLCCQDYMTLNVSDGPIRGLAISPKDNWFATGDDHGTIAIWDSSSGEPLRQWQAHDGLINTLLISSDGNFLWSCSSDRTIASWNPLTGEKHYSLVGHQDSISAIGLVRQR